MGIKIDNNESTQVNSLINTITNSNKYKKLISFLEDFVYNQNISKDMKTDFLYWVDNCTMGKIVLNLCKKENISVKYMSQLKNCNFLISNEREIYIYDEFSSNKLFHQEFDSEISCICEIKNENINKLFIIISTEDGHLYKINFENKTILLPMETKILEIKLDNIIEVKEKVYIISNNKGTYYYNGLIYEINNSNFNEQNLISKEVYKVGKVINNRFVILMNNIYNRGNLIIYDIIKKKIICTKSIKKLFVLSKNCLYLFELKNEKILICLCKNNHTNEKNAIFSFKIEFQNENLIISNNENDDNDNDDSDDYIIDCLFPIKFLKEHNNLLGRENDNIYDSMFLITCGSFINGKKEKIIETRIYYLGGIKPQFCTKINFNDNGFDNNISCMIQSNINGHFFFSSIYDNCLKEYSINLISDDSEKIK